MYNVLDISPVVFLKLAQDQVGESDLIYTKLSANNISEVADTFMYSNDAYVKRRPRPVFNLPFVNSTLISEEVKNSSYYEGVSPRWIGVAQFANTTNQDLSTPGVIFIIDTAKEVEIGLGRDFSKTVLKQKQVFVNKSALKYLGIQANWGDQIQLVIDLNQYINFTSQKSFDDSPLIHGFKNGDISLYKAFYNAFEHITALNSISISNDIYILRLNYYVVESFESPSGKFGDSYGNVMVLDSNFILPDMINALKENIVKFSNTKVSLSYIDKLLQPIIDIRINDYALQVDAVLRDREKYYISDKDKFNKEYARKAMTLNMGITTIDPVNQALASFAYIKLFLENTFLTIVVFIVILSAMLIYSLMVSDIDERTYEMAMLRALGLKSSSIVVLILLQSMIFSVPGVLIGVVISALLNIFVR